MSHSVSVLSFLFLLALLTSGCTQKDTKAVGAEFKNWITATDGSKRLASLPEEANPVPKNCAIVTNSSSSVSVDPSTAFQTVAGFGAALTESSAILFNQMDEKTRAKTLSDLFSESGSLRLNLLRIPIGATDFSTGNYSCADADGDSDPKPVARLFDFKRCIGNILPVLTEIKRIRPSLKIIATPWSAPAWMKNSQSLVGGKLQPKYYSEYAEYLSLFLEKMEQAGLPVDYLTVVNEPLFTDESHVNYPWMNMAAEEQAEFIGQFLGPLLKARGQLDKIKILGYDHNWDNWNYPAKLLKTTDSQGYLTGTAFHCYRGHHSAAQALHDLFPNKEIHLTECTSGKWSPQFSESFDWALNNLFVGHFSAGAQSLVYWNLLLNADGGPTNGGCQNCRGIINLKPDGIEIEKSPEYYVLAHASKVVDPGARRIVSTTSSLKTQIGFQNPDGSLSWVGTNSSDSQVQLDFKSPRGCFSVNIPPNASISLRW